MNKLTELMPTEALKAAIPCLRTAFEGASERLNRELSRVLNGADQADNKWTVDHTSFSKVGWALCEAEEALRELRDYEDELRSRLTTQWGEV